MKIKISKYHGCGNDFILIDEKDIRNLDEKQIRELVIEAADRHTGVGADGVIFVKTDPLEMIYFNQDGSRADMCGNGLRCFSDYVFNHRFNSQEENREFVVQTLAGPKQARIQKDGLIQVELGEPSFDPIDLKLSEPMDHVPWNYPVEININNEWISIPIYSVYMNTMHSVVFVKDAFDPELEKIGEALCHHPLFSDQCNINFVEIIDDQTFKASTYERGCGMTLACGTGMAASALVLNLEKGLKGPLRAILKKGELFIDIDDEQKVSLIGPARKVFEGEYIYD